MNWFLGYDFLENVIYYANMVKYFHEFPSEASLFAVSLVHYHADILLTARTMLFEYSKWNMCELIEF